MGKEKKSTVWSHLKPIRKDVIVNVNDIDSIVVTNKDQSNTSHADKRWYRVNMMKNKSPYDYVLLSVEEYEKYVKPYINK